MYPQTREYAADRFATRKFSGYCCVTKRVNRYLMNQNKLIVFIISFFITNLAQADLKRLVCDVPPTSDTAERLLAFYQRSCEKGRKDACEQISVVSKRIEECKIAEKPFSMRSIFTFDTSALQGNTKSYAEYETIPCYTTYTPEILRVEIESTPSTIIFVIPHQSDELREFQVNRETLVGTYAKKTQMCKIEDLPKGKNKI